MVAERIPTTILRLARGRQSSSNEIDSITGLSTPNILRFHATFREPDHTISDIGRRWLHVSEPGEVSRRTTVCSLWTSCPSSTIGIGGDASAAGGRASTVSRAAGSVTFPSAIHAGGRMNPCPCGHSAI